MNITRIKEDRYRIGRYVLSLTELRQFMLEVVRGEKPANVKVTNLTTGVYGYILPNGSLTDCVIDNKYANISIQMLKEARKREL
jgi:hypothetical protein